MLTIHTAQSNAIVAKLRPLLISILDYNSTPFPPGPARCYRNGSAMNLVVPLGVNAYSTVIVNMQLPRHTTRICGSYSRRNKFSDTFKQGI